MVGWETGLLLFVRVWAVLRAQVLWQRAVGPWWWIVAAGPAAVLAISIPTSDVPGPALDGSWVPLVLSELVVGTVVGLVASLPGYALVGAGAQMESAFGLQRLRSQSLSTVVLALTLSLSLAAGVHHPLLLALRDGAALLPPGKLELWAVVAEDGVAMVAPAVHGAVVLGLALCAPVLLAAAVAEAVHNVDASPGRVKLVIPLNWCFVQMLEAPPKGATEESLGFDL